MHMQDNIRDEVVPRLIRDFTLKPSSDRQFLRYGRCPTCNKKELFTSATSPWTVQCGRLNKCGFSANVRDLYPDVFEQWTKRNPPTQANPHATADAYLSSGRGFDITKIKGAYTQEVWHDYHRTLTSPTVRFPIYDESGNLISWWERLIEPPKGIKKAYIQPKSTFRGLAWLPPKLSLHGTATVWSFVKEIWITEGIFDAIALGEHGIHAISSLSCSNYPDKTLAAIKQKMQSIGKPMPRIVLALDNDTAGQDYTLKHYYKARQQGYEVLAAQSSEFPSGKEDWNDLHQRGKLTADDIDRYSYYGRLLTAETPKDKAELIHYRYDRTSFYMFFDRRTFWVNVDMEGARKEIDKSKEEEGCPHPDFFNTEEELKEAQKVWQQEIIQSYIKTNEIMNCQPQALYYQQDLATDESWYFFRIRTPHGDYKNTFTGGQLSAAGEFKKRLLSVAPGVIYQGNSKQLDVMLGKMISGINTVQTINWVGYSAPHETYIFNEVAVQKGKVYTINQDDYFELPSNTSLKTLAASPKIKIAEPPAQTPNWLGDIINGWGTQGVISLVGFLGSLFAHQIRDKQKSYPFLEIVGDPGTGKSTLLGFFWRLIGRDSYEGIDPNKTTKAGRARALSQTSNMPSVFIESDRDNAGSGGRSTQFNWDELKNLYDGGTIATRGIKSAGNEVYEPPFRGTVIISQNLPVVASKAILSRICHLFFRADGQTRDSEAAARRIESYQTEQVSHFLLTLLKAESQFLEVFFNTKMSWEIWLKDSGIKNFRVAHCHAQLLALFDALAATALPDLARIRESVKSDVFKMAQERDTTMDTEHPLNIQFFDVIESLNTAPWSQDKGGAHIRRLHINHSKDPSMLAISLSEIYQLANEYRYDLPPQADMQHALRQSRQYKFVAANRVVNSKQTNAAKRCWVFEIPRDTTIT